MNHQSLGIFRATALGLLGATAALLASCSLPAIEPARADATRYYLLGGAAGLQFAPTGINLVPVRVSPYLQSRLMAVRVGPNEVRFAAESHWAEPLDTAITQLLRARLAKDAAGRDCTVQVLVQQCEGATGADNNVRFAAIFEITAGGTAAKAERHEFTAKPRKWDGKDYGQLAVQLREAVGELGESILAALPGKM